MNCITLIGRLGSDPDIKYFESGANVAKFSLAVDRGRREDGEKVTDWFACECWNKTAEVVANFCRKGKQIAIQGRIEFEHWTDKATGENRSKPVVKINNLELLGNIQAASDEVNHVESQPEVRVPVAVGGADDGGDIPF